MDDFCCLPTLVTHADWSSTPKKRWMVQAILKEDGYYWVSAPEKVVDPASLIARLQHTAGSRGMVLLGFDFPIGLPWHYADRCGIDNFLSVLPKLGQGEWDAFYEVAEQPEQISLHRPFYPHRPGNARQSHLIQALGVETIGELRRLCEFPHPNRRAAAPLFWTIGGQQVGKAAIAGWRELLAPALSSASQSIHIWPFAGRLSDLCRSGRTVVAETYPAEFYNHLGVTFPPHSSGGKGGKRSQVARIHNAAALLSWAQTAGVSLSPLLKSQIQEGFGPSPEGEDLFDATIGLLGMLNIVLGLHPAGEPVDERLCRVEGWILGQDPGLLQNTV